ncbi:hypothetical protein [Pseudoduganella chitinolytica]|uniref:Uncharacterized protein n=1 Tax=Pseudoduganella chitinolytica TaxID=34070 RepID=A0ABY8BAP9_9BURK|nr:hypothetical protein [Pseudoduganella chitinolytica]WEF32997.1 hypothetical protein PX653_27005 [Pseudoduganella chitinolytica]
MNRRDTLLSLLLAGVCTAGQAGTAKMAHPWSAIAPLVAGAYSGICGERPGGADKPGKITVDADGKARAPGMMFDPRDSQLMELWRGREGKTVQSKVVLRAEYEAAYFILLPDNGAYSAALKEGEQTLGCDGVAAPARLNGQPLALSLAPLLDASRTIECRTGAEAPPRDALFRLARGKVQLGDRTFDLTQPGTETLSVGKGRGMQYGFELNDGRAFTVLYDVRGGVKGAALYEHGEPVLGCGSDE